MNPAQPSVSVDTTGQPTDSSGYPLSLALTRRVVNYLTAFRLFISLALTFAYFSGALVQGETLGNPTFAGSSLVSYFIMGAYLLVESRRSQANFYHLAQVSLLVDVLFLGLLLFLFGGLSSGLAVLLVFTILASSVLLPLRVALFLAALASMAIIGESLLGGYLRSGTIENLLQSGLYGLTIFIITLLAHALAFWVRDFRLIAERQMITLTRLEQINELIIRRMSSGVLAVDYRGEIQLMNESAWFSLGSPSASDRKLAEVSPELNEALEQWRADPKRENQALVLTASQAEVIPKFVNLPSGREVRSLIFLEDSDVVSQRAVELSANSLAKLSGSIAHEIRNPLAAISHAAQLLGEAEHMQQADSRLITIIQNQARRMNGIVENILQLSRREKSQPELFELVPWLREFLEEFSGASEGTDIQLVLPDTRSPMLVMFDRSQLHQALWKLLENARQHAGKEGEPPAIWLRMEADEASGHCVVSVEDNGNGIPEERIGSIFEPFFTTRKQGSGLGLYIARQLCEANQAELTVDSTTGWKTRFHIRMALSNNEPDQGLLGIRND